MYPLKSANNIKGYFKKTFNFKIYRMYTVQFHKVFFKEIIYILFILFPIPHIFSPKPLSNFTIFLKTFCLI